MASVGYACNDHMTRVGVRAVVVPAAADSFLVGIQAPAAVVANLPPYALADALRVTREQWTASAHGAYADPRRALVSRR
jgi:hypothetical protein